MQNIVTTNCTISNMEITNKAEISLTSNNSEIDNITISPLFTNIVKLNGDYTNSNVSIETNCILISDSTFTCYNPITLAKDNLNIFLAGDFSNSSGINIHKNVKFNTYEHLPLSNVEITIQSLSTAYLLGDFSQASITLQSNSSLVIDGSIKSITTTNSTDTVNINLSSDASIGVTNINSNINLSGDSNAIKEFLYKNPDLKNKITITSTSYYTTLKNGEGNINLGTLNTGIYKITASVIDDENEYVLINPTTVEIINP